MTHPIKAVFFDLDGTLRIPSPGPTAAFIHFARTLDIDIPPPLERRVKVWAHEYWGQDQLVKQDMDRFDVDEFWINYSKLLLQTIEATHDLNRRARLVREWFDTGYKPEVTLAPGSRQTLQVLKEQGLIIGLISNRSQPLTEAVMGLGLGDIFDTMLAAGEVGYWKPDPRIFFHVLSQFKGLKASECLYVGDNYFADGRGAEAAGMIPVLFDPEDLYDKAPVRRIRQMAEIPALLTAVYRANGHDHTPAPIAGGKKEGARMIAGLRP